MGDEGLIMSRSADPMNDFLISGVGMGASVPVLFTA
jgi:hypothetical protein